VLESAMVLLQTVPTHVDLHEIEKKLLAIDGVRGVHEFHVWRLAGDRIIASAHITFSTLKDYMRIASRVKKVFHEEGIHSTTIQPEALDVSRIFALQSLFLKVECF
jgi:zinc transporter 1